MKAIVTGLPMVCLPMVRDQNDAAARVVVRAPACASNVGASAAAIEAAVT